VIAAGLVANAFEVSTTVGGSAVNTSGTQSGTHSIVAEETLLDTSATGTYVLTLDTNAMAAGDVAEVRIYKMVLTSGTRRVLYFVRFFDAQPTDDLIKIWPPVPIDITDSGAFRATLKQTAGTARAFPWSVAEYT
jgi:hypothetical protein